MGFRVECIGFRVEAAVATFRCNARVLCSVLCDCVEAPGFSGCMFRV